MRRLTTLLGLAVLAVLSVVAQFVLRANRRDSAPAVAEGALAALGGVRSVAAEVVWFRIDRLQDEGRYVELAQLAKTLSCLEPHTPEVWGYAAWNLAYNISVMMPTYEDRWRWVKSALRLLRDEGLVLNPREAELYRELAWMFELKLGTDLDSAAAVYRTKWRETVTDVARRGAWSELRMDPAAMGEVERVYGVTDAADPQYSAVYWAHAGLRHAVTESERRALSDIIRQARRLYLKAHGG